jgi:hypothetical protein
MWPSAFAFSVKAPRPKVKTERKKRTKKSTSRFNNIFNAKIAPSTFFGRFLAWKGENSRELENRTNEGTNSTKNFNLATIDEQMLILDLHLTRGKIKKRARTRRAERRTCPSNCP